MSYKTNSHTSRDDLGMRVKFIGHGLMKYYRRYPDTISHWNRKPQLKIGSAFKKSEWN
jgi:hypothetical protein